MPLAPIGSAFRINTANGNSQFDSDIAATPNKRFAVVWYDIGANSGDIKAQWLDPQGSPLGSEVTVNKTVAGEQRAPTIVATGNCLVYVAWQEFNSSTGIDIKFNNLRPFELANDPSSRAPDYFLTQAVNNQTAPFLAANPAPGNLFDIIWTDGLTGFLQGKSFSVKNSNFDTIVQISASNNGVVNGSFAYGPNNKIAFILDDNSNNAVGDGIFAATGTAGWPTAALPFTRIDPGAAFNQSPRASVEGHSKPDVAFGGPNGDIPAYVWSNEFSGRQFDILMQFNGVTKVVNATSTVGTQVTPAISALPSGGFLVVWGHEDGSVKEVRAQEVSPAGELVGPEVNVSGTGVIAYQPKVAVNSDGTALISWTQSGTNSSLTVSGLDIVGRLFDTRPQPTVPSTPGNDTIVGTAGNDVINAGGGNDVIRAGAGNDTIDGGDGVDSSVFVGRRVDASVSNTTFGVAIQDTVSGRNGADLFSNVERIRFDDGSLALDIALPGLGDSNAGSAYRLYKAAFNRTPEPEGLAFWIGYLDSGRSVLEAAGGFASSVEFRQIYSSNPSAAQLVTSFYTNILGRAPEQAGYDFWFNILNNQPEQRAYVLANISNSQENQDGLVGVIGQGIWVPGAML